MIRVNLLQKPTVPRCTLVFRRLVKLFGRVPTPKPKPAARVDRRVFRSVLCGSCGAGENWKESCPRCGGYVERLAWEPMLKRLRKGHAAAKRLMRQMEKELAAKRRL